jgi:hypothetical protein
MAQISVPLTADRALTVKYIKYNITVFVTTFDTSTSGYLPDVDIYVDGSYVGRTGSSGTLTVTVSYGPHTFLGRKIGYNDASVAYSPPGNMVRLDLAPVAPPPKASLWGYVLNSATGRAVSGATVRCAGKSTSTDTVGYFKLTDLSTGSQTLEISKSGYVTYSTSITLVGGDNSAGTIRLNPS